MMELLSYLFEPTRMDHTLFCILGIVISVYSLYIEIKKSENPSYKALCDFNENMSCSRVLTSEYSKGFGMVEILFGKEHFLNVPNCALGIGFYTIQLLLGLLGTSWASSLLMLSSVASIIGSVYLCFILLFVLKDFCLVCFTIYIINGTLMYLNYQIYYHKI